MLRMMIRFMLLLRTRGLIMYDMLRIYLCSFLPLTILSSLSLR